MRSQQTRFHSINYRGSRHARLTKSMKSIPRTILQVLVELRYMLADGETRAISNAALARRCDLSEGFVSAAVRWLAGEAIAYYPSMKVAPTHPFIERRPRRHTPGFEITMLPPPELRTMQETPVVFCAARDHGGDPRFFAEDTASTSVETAQIGDHARDPSTSCIHDHESINEDSSTMHDHGGPSGGTIFPEKCQTAKDECPDIHLLDKLVLLGHKELNLHRPIPPGEWWELLALQDAHGPEKLLIWQARAHRCSTQRLQGIIPAYYVQCAAQETFATVRIARSPVVAPAAPPDRLSPAACVDPPPLAAPNPANEQLLAEIEQRLGSPIARRVEVLAQPYEQLARWHAAIHHRGFKAHFASPAGFFVQQVLAGHAPPSVAMLDRWSQNVPYSVTELAEAFRRNEMLVSGADVCEDPEVMSAGGDIGVEENKQSMRCERAQNLEPDAAGAGNTTCPAEQKVPHPSDRTLHSETEAFRQALQARVDSRYHHLLSGVQVRHTTGVPVIVCASHLLHDQLLTRFYDALLGAWQSLGYTGQPVLVMTAHKAPPQARVDTNDGRPSWIAAERWETLSPSLRNILRGSILQEGCLMGLSAGALRNIELHFRSLVTELINSARTDHDCQL